MIRFLPISLVIAIHDDQVRLYGGSYGLRDQGALEAALAMPQARFGGQFLHGTIFHMAAAYGFHLCQNHPFIDGNKRVAGMTMFAFLQLNGLKPIASEIDYYNTMMAVASGQLNKEQLTNWLPAVVRGSPPSLET
ncbi:MAG: type II toxin-antitoxin system death-on-curing family toxin [Ktedonobacteraceae bacterium]|nr:type II toxin-antitoxin system death-on-curing family toxin [Ktedonobacteraceae bacterium]